MSTMGRHTPCAHPIRPHVPAQRLTRFVQQTGRLLCWSLTAGMTTAALELLTTPKAAWWHMLWPLPWYLTCVSAPLWAALRAHEKAARQQAREEDNDIPGEWEQAA